MRIWFYPRILFLLMALVVQACKDKDEQFPSVLISQPNNGASYQVFDTVTVVYSAADESQLESVVGQLLDQNLIPIGPQVSADVIGNAFSGSFELVISDKLTPSGSYFIMVKAFDGTNEQREFVEIQIQAMPKERRAVYAATAGQQTAIIWKVDSLFQQAELWTSAGQDVLGIHVNSLEDKLSIVGRYSTALSTYSLLSRTVVWEDQTFPLGQTERYTYLHGFKNTLYAGLYDRELRAYSSHGALTLIRPTGDFRPETIYADDIFLLVEMNLVGDDRHFIYVYNALTQGLLWQSEFPMDIVSICPLQQDEVLVFGNDNGQARVFHFDVGNNGYWEPRQLPQGKVLKAVKLNGPQFAISHGNGIYAYTYSPNYLNLIASANVYQDLSFDVDNGTIVAASGNLLQQFTVAGQTVGTIALSDSIVSVDIHYTR